MYVHVYMHVNAFTREAIKWKLACACLCQVHSYLYTTCRYMYVHVNTFTHEEIKLKLACACPCQMSDAHALVCPHIKLLEI